MENFGDKLYQIVSNTKASLFLQGEMAELTFAAYNEFVKTIENMEDDEIAFTYPVGFKADHTPIQTTHNYSKEKLIERYNYLAQSRLPKNGIYNLVTNIEALLGDIIRQVLMQFPSKISDKKSLKTGKILGAKSLEEIKLSIVDEILNDLTYKKPKEFAEEFDKYVGINLLEYPAYHKYIELKATRDIHIHNKGIANEIYLSKSDTLARVNKNDFLPVTIQYFLESYEACLQLTEILERDLDKIWPSQDYRDYKEKINIENEQQEAVDEAIKKSGEEE